MRHFMAQFGPALQWPWTKLMDVPDLTDALLDTIVAQSDEQADGRSVRELEQLRDDCLVSVLQALRAHDIGAGAVLARHARRARGLAAHERDGRRRRSLAPAGPALGEGRARLGRLQRPRAREPLPAGVRRRLRRAVRISRHRCRVPDAAAATSPSRATSRTCARRSRATGSSSRPRCSTWTRAGCTSSTRSPRESDGALLATAEQLFLHVDTVARRAAPAGAAVLARAERLAEAHAFLPRPEQAGRAIGIGSPSAESASAQTAPALRRAIRRAAVAASLRAAFALPSVRVATTIT